MRTSTYLKIDIQITQLQTIATAINDFLFLQLDRWSITEGYRWKNWHIHIKTKEIQKDHCAKTSKEILNEASILYCRNSSAKDVKDVNELFV